MKDYNEIVAPVRDTLVDAGFTFCPDKKEACRRAIEKERNKKVKWVLQTILDNADVAEKNKSPQLLASGGATLK